MRTSLSKRGKSPYHISDQRKRVNDMRLRIPEMQKSLYRWNTVLSWKNV
jgi:hypothetical protein